jgi:hypothetical protein
MIYDILCLAFFLAKFYAGSRWGSISHVTGPLARSGSVYIRIQWSYTVYNWSHVKWELSEFPYKFADFTFGVSSLCT